MRHGQKCMFENKLILIFFRKNGGIVRLNYLSSVDTESRTKLLLYHEKLKSIKEAAPSLDFD